jgi:hypothetical protein
VEVGRFAVLTLKVYHAASTLGDLASREERLTDAFLANSFDAVQHVMAPFDIGSDGVAIVSGIGLNAQGNPRVLWQRPGAGSLTAASAIGAVGASPNLPADLEVRDGEAVLATEVFFRYEGWLLGIVPDTTVRRVAFHRPRLGALETIDEG